MNKLLPCMTVVMAAAGFSAAAAQDTPTKTEEDARYDAVLQEANDDANLTFAALPAIEDKRARNSILRYNTAARAWWIETRCKFGTPDETKQFQADLTLFTNSMDLIFSHEFHKSLKEGNSYSQTVQMYALNAISAKKFYECSEKARDAWLVGQDITQWAGDIIRNRVKSLAPQPVK